MPIIDYSKTKIYKIQCKNKSVQDVFYGHCSKLSNVKYRLKIDIENGKDTHICNTIRENGGIENWNIVVMESYIDCKTKEQADYRVNELETQNKSVNPIILNPNQISMNLLSDTINNKSENLKLFNCNICNKKFTLKTNLTRHQKTICKKSTNENEFETQLKEKEEKIKNLEEHIKKQDDEIKELKQTNSTQINTVNNITNNNNNVQNNIIFELGNENFDQILTDQQKLQILNQKYSSIEYFIKKYNCNRVYPQFQNVKITSMTKSHCKVYSKNDKKYITKDLKDVIEQIVDCRIGDLNIILDETPNVPENTNIAIRGLIEKMDTDEEYKKNKYKKVKMTMYSESCDT